MEATQLAEVVHHRKLILPQLGAPGVAGYAVKIRSGFKVEYGPVRAADLPEYLKTHQATPEMRRVLFTFFDRLVLVPVEVVYVPLPLFLAIGIAFLIGGLGFVLAVTCAILAGVVLFPLLLPWIPTPNFSTKGFLLGLLVALPFAISTFLSSPATAWWLQVLSAFGMVLTLAPITAYLALNFTGATTFTSRTGVRREMFAYIPAMAWMLGSGILLDLISLFVP